MYKQLIIARKDLNLSNGKFAAQVSHASMAFLSKFIRDNANIYGHVNGYIDEGIFHNWIEESFTKIVCEAKNKSHLLKAKRFAEEMGMIENEDFFLIKDNCYTELEPEEVDENGVGRTLTCIGFKPMDSEIIDKIGKKFQLYKTTNNEALERFAEKIKRHLNIEAKLCEQDIRDCTFYGRLIDRNKAVGYSNAIDVAIGIVDEEVLKQKRE